MKIRPVILCGGAGTRLSPLSNNLPKQFIDFGGWNLFEKTLERIKNPVFDNPIISTNKKYLNLVKRSLKKKKFKKFILVLEPLKKNTAAAILISSLVEEVSHDQNLVFFSSDHLIEKNTILTKSLLSNYSKLNSDNMCIFGIKPRFVSSDYGYFLTKKNANQAVVKKFIEKPKINLAKKLLKKGALWNSGIFFIKKISLLKNFMKYQPKILKNCKSAISKSKKINNCYYININEYKKNPNKSFDYAIVEKINTLFAIPLNINWSDLGKWKEICSMFKKNKSLYFNKKNIFYRPWGNYINLFKGKGFLVKEINVKSNGVLSLQKHYHRSEHWLVSRGVANIILRGKKIIKYPNEDIFIPKGVIHRVTNNKRGILKIIEIQIGKILKESDIVRYQDVYGRIK